MRRKILLVVALALLLQLAWVPVSSAAPPPWGGGFYHWVRWGETLASIGWMYGVNPYAICAANGLANCNFIYAGQRLWIPGRGWYPGPWDGGPRHGCVAWHHVYYGQTLSGIAAWYGVSTWALARANGIHNPNMLYAGRNLCIPGWGWGYWDP